MRRALATSPDPMQIFYAIDTDNSGEISKEEFEEAIDKMSDSDIRKYSKLAFRAIDSDSSGAISEQEFKEAIGVLENSELIYLQKGLSRNELSNTPESDRQDQSDETIASLLGRRFFTTAEVAVSKIFPAGFGWQGGALVAGAMGYGATDVPLFLMAGVGDAVGVGVGHFGYMFIKNAMGYKQDMTAQAHTSVLLSTACIFSGTAWQPIVNFLHDTAHLDFNAVAGGVVVGCSFAFFAGLRFGRLVWSPILNGVAPSSYANLKADALLGVAVGGATGAFVGTDVSFEAAPTATDAAAPSAAPVDTNWLRPVVGIEETAGDLEGMVTAGASTLMGFSVFQSIQNILISPGKNWVD